MFAKYLLRNNEIFLYIEYALYRLEKIMIVFENHCLIDVK